MSAQAIDTPIAEIAAAIGEPARTRMLYCLMDGHARTSIELATVAGVSPSTASVHLARLKSQRLVKVLAQGKHRYYSLASPGVAAALEALAVVAGTPGSEFVPHTPERLRSARTCYDHMAGAVAVALHDEMLAREWLAPGAEVDAYELTAAGEAALVKMGVDVPAIKGSRRRFAYGCLDWSERRPHVAGAMGAALLTAAIQKKWVVRDLDSRSLTITAAGRHALKAQFSIQL